MKEKIIELSPGKKVPLAEIEKNMALAQKEIQAILDKYGMILQGKVEFYTAEVQVAPRIDTTGG